MIYILLINMFKLFLVFEKTSFNFSQENFNKFIRSPCIDLHTSYK